MFTGIIQKLGTIVEVDTQAASGALILACTPWTRPYELGESIAINGVCLSVVEARADTLRFDVLQETFRKTNLGALRPGSVVNLERALRYGDALGGHLVSGHVDAVGKVLRVDAVGRDRRVEIELPETLRSTVVPKGSIACDGISLTVAELFDESFAVHLIPATLQDTYWSELEVGMPVNLESDQVCKIVVKAAQRGVLADDWSWEKLGVDWNNES